MADNFGFIPDSSDDIGFIPDTSGQSSKQLKTSDDFQPDSTWQKIKDVGRDLAVNTGQVGLGLADDALALGPGAYDLARAGLNLIPGVNLPYLKPIQVAPDTLPATAGKVAGMLAIPNPLEVGALGAAYPITSRVAGNMLISGALNPEHPALGLAGGAGGGVIGELARIAQNPLVSALARGTAGASIGYPLGGYTGALTGAGIGMGLPGIGRALGVSGGQPGAETIANINAQEALNRQAAANRLGTSLTPAEASGNPYIKKLQGAYGHTGEAAAEKVNLDATALQSQKNAIGNLLNTIYDKSPQAADKIRSLYQQAFQWSAKPETIAALKQDPVIAEAFNSVAKDAPYQKALQGVPEGNFQQLDMVKKAIDDKIGTLSGKEPTKAAQYTDAKNNLINFMDTYAPEYAQARAEAQRSIIRSNIQKAMSKKQISGKDFYNTFLQNDNSYNKLLNSLSNVPEAQNQLRDMKTAWEFLIRPTSPANVAYQDEGGLGVPINPFNYLAEMVSNLTGQARNKNAINYIYSDRWVKDLQKMQGMPTREQRGSQLANMIGRATIGTASTQQGRKNDNQLQSTP